MPKSKIGEDCVTNKDCVNDNCVDGKCRRKERTRKNKPKTPSPVKEKTPSPVKEKTPSPVKEKKRSPTKKKRVGFASNNETRKISHRKDDLFFSDLDEDLRTTILKLLSYDADDDYFTVNQYHKNLPFFVDIHMEIAKQQSVTTDVVKSTSRKVLEKYRKMALKQEELDKKKYAKNIDEFISDKKPLPKKFEHILLSTSTQENIDNMKNMKKYKKIIDDEMETDVNMNTVKNKKIEYNAHNVTKKVSPKQLKVITTEDTKPVKVEATKKVPKKKIVIHTPAPPVSEPEPIPEPEPEPKKKIAHTPAPVPKETKDPICKTFTKVDKIEEFKKNGMSVLQKCSKDELRAMVEEANKAFHCTGNPLMSDAEYDILYDYLKTKDNTISDTVGAPIVKNKVKLPYEMWSMDKIKPDTNILTTWKQKYKGPYVISCKLDGVSGLYSTEGSEPKLYTRGDGKVGQDISHMIPYLRLPKTKGLVMRGEFIILEDKFKHDYKEKFSNSRNLVAGIVNKKKSKDTLETYKDIDFVAYELIKHPDHETILPSQQMELLSSMDLEVVKYEVHENIDNDMLSGILKDWRTNYKYTIDGIIVCDDKVYQRTSSNPKHAFAFKMVLSDQVAEAHVVDVLWSPSKDGYLKPRVEITPVYLGGVKITYATGFNAQFIESNKIGIGAIITLVRSGDVIPYIQSVNEPASEPKMPNEPYVWNSTHVDIMLENKSDNETVLEKNITGFFKGLEVEALGAGNVKKLISGGFNSIEKIIKMSIEDFLSIDGFKKKMAEKIHNSIKEKLEKAKIVHIAAHCNIFGRGFSEKKLEVIFNAHSDILTNPVSVETLAKVKQIEKKTAQAFLDHIDEFKEFLAATNLTHKMDTALAAPAISVSTDHVLYGKNIVFTGFRNKELEAKLKAIGAKVTTSVNKKTHVLLVKSKDDDSSKIEEAKKLQIEIMTPDEFIAKYDM